MVNVKEILGGLCFNYSTPKTAVIKDPKAGVLYRLIAIGILLYVVLFQIIYKKGYADTEFETGLVATKIAGNSTVTAADGTQQVFDAYDVVDPALDTGGFFVSTVVRKNNQTRSWVGAPEAGECTDNATCASAMCGEGDDRAPCAAFRPSWCNSGQCLYQSWTPPDDSKEYQWSASNLSGITIWFKGSIEFPNLAPDHVFSTIQSPEPVRYDPVNKVENPNLYSVQDLVDLSGYGDENGTAGVMAHGAILKVVIVWDCDLNKAFDKSCQKTFSVERLDNADIGDGFNLREISYWDADGDFNPDGREILKRYGVRVFLLSQGVASKFSLATLVINIGSGLALFAVATVITDLVLVHVFGRLENRSDVYKSWKEDVYDTTTLEPVAAYTIPFVKGNNSKDSLENTDATLLNPTS